MQPVQDLTVEDRVSRTQYQYSLEDADGRELSAWAPQLVDALRARAGAARREQRPAGPGARHRAGHRPRTASRLGVSPQTIDNTLYDAFGQRQVSTMFTQLNQYRVVLEVQARLPPERHRRCATSTSRGTSGGQPVTVPLSTMTSVEETTRPAGRSRTRDSSRRSRSRSTWRRAPLSARRSRAIETTTRQLGLPASIQGSFQGTAQAFRASLANEPLLILAALVTVYIVLGVLYESYIHPLTILSTLPSAGVGAILALLLCRHRAERDRADRHHPADRHREEERDHDDRLRAGRRARSRARRPRDAIYQACLLRFRPIMMTTMAALLGALPLALGTGVGSELRRPLGIAIVGGLIVSQVLTLYTTPVIYLGLRPASRARVRAPASRGAARESTCRGRRPGHEHLRALHPAAGRHDAAHDRRSR